MGLRKRLAAWLMPSGEVAQLRREREHHKAAAEGRWADVYLMHAGPVGGGFEITMRSPMSLILVEHLGRLLSEVGAENWVEVCVNHREFGALVLTVQRRRGETPGDQIQALKAKLAAIPAESGTDSPSGEAVSAGSLPPDEQS